MMTATDDSSRLNARPLIAGLGELDEFAGHDLGQAVAAGDAVADFEHLPDLAGLDLPVELRDLLGDDAEDFAGISCP